jgi:hypothetical protein
MLLEPYVVLAYPFATSVYNELRIRALVPFMYALTQFIALTAIDIFAYCSIGFMVRYVHGYASCTVQRQELRKLKY